MTASSTSPTSSRRPIIAAVDFSAESERAARLALARAVNAGVTLHLLHVHPSPELATSIFGEPLQVPREVYELVIDHRRACAGKLAVLAADLRRAASGITIEEHVDYGEPGAGIVELARCVEAGLIVMATRGVDATKFLLGSVAAHVAQHAPCPVLVADRSHEPTATSAFRRVLCGMDEAPWADAVARLAARFTEPDGVVELVHVWQAPHLTWLHAPADRAVIEAAAAEVAKRHLQGHADVLRTPERRVETWTGRGSAAGVLFDRARDTRADLVVVGAHRRHGAERFLGTVADRVLRFATTAVLLVPAPALASLDAA